MKQEKITELEQEISIIKWKVAYYEKVIKNAWWVLTDIDSQDLNAEIYRRLVVESLSEIACEVLDKEELNDK
jgi:hypothetical protein